MRVLLESEINVVSGGEVGATGMGDDYSYTGSHTSIGDCITNTFAQAYSNGGIGSVGFGEAAWGCLIGWL
jgi:hypothetical protein